MATTISDISNSSDSVWEALVVLEDTGDLRAALSELGSPSPADLALFYEGVEDLARKHRKADAYQVCRGGSGMAARNAAAAIRSGADACEAAILDQADERDEACLWPHRAPAPWECLGNGCATERLLGAQELSNPWSQGSSWSRTIPGAGQPLELGRPTGRQDPPSPNTPRNHSSESSFRSKPAAIPQLRGARIPA